MTKTNSFRVGRPRCTTLASRSDVTHDCISGSALFGFILVKRYYDILPVDAKIRKI